MELTDCSDFPNLDFLPKPLHGGAVRPIRVSLVRLVKLSAVMILVADYYYWYMYHTSRSVRIVYLL